MERYAKALQAYLDRYIADTGGPVVDKIDTMLGDLEYQENLLARMKVQADRLRQEKAEIVEGPDTFVEVESKLDLVLRAIDKQWPIAILDERLEAEGHDLSFGSKEDLILRFFIKEEIFDLNLINRVLRAYECDALEKD